MQASQAATSPRRRPELGLGLECGVSCKLEMNLVCDEENIVVSPMHVTYVCLEIMYIKNMKGFPKLCYCTGATPQV
jgi:hypothetical protein